MTSTELKEDLNLVDALILADVCKSKREARELISGNSISLNGEKVTDPNFILNQDSALYNNLFILRKGKKNYFVLKRI